MKSYTEKRKIILNPCKYCGETEIDIVNNMFNHQYHCTTQCKCGAYVQRYCTNDLLLDKLELSVIEVWNNGDISKPIR